MKMSKLETAIREAKILLIREFPFMSFMVMSMEYGECNELPMKTMAATIINGKPTVLFDRKFTLETLQDVGERAYVVAHEILHIYLDHLGRQKLMGYHHKLWNIATDYCINRGLNELGSKKITSPTQFGLLDDVRFTTMSADLIYETLLKENDNDAKKACDACGVGSFDEVSWESLSEAEQAELRAALSASLSQARDFGHESSSLFRMLKDIITPKLDWKQVLREYILLSANSRHTYRKYNRRSTDVIFPSFTGDAIDIAVGVDTSGSMSDTDLMEAYTELRSILVNFDSWRLTLLSCDTVAHVIGEYSFDEGHDTDTISKEVIGGGGTDMNPIIGLCEELESPPTVLVIITDGHVPKINGSDTIPTIIIVTSGGVDTFERSNIECVIKI